MVTFPTAGIYNDASNKNQKLKPKNRKTCSHLISHILLKVLVGGNVQADAAVFQPLGLDFVRRGGDRRNDHVREREALLQRRVAGVYHMPGMVSPRCF